MIYFARHGESQANVDKVIAGPVIAAPLTTKGREQARVEGLRIKAEGLVIDRIVASPIERAQDTAQIIATSIDYEPQNIQTDARLAEYDAGSLCGQPFEGLKSEQRVTARGAEDPYAFQKRVMSCLADIRKLPGNTLVVSHAGVGRIIEATRLGIAPPRFYELVGYPNAQVVSLG